MPDTEIARWADVRCEGLAWPLWPRALSFRMANSLVRAAGRAHARCAPTCAREAVAFEPVAAPNAKVLRLSKSLGLALKTS